jgi:ribosomal protein L2
MILTSLPLRVLSPTPFPFGTSPTRGKKKVNQFKREKGKTVFKIQKIIHDYNRGNQENLVKIKVQTINLFIFAV